MSDEKYSVYVIELKKEFSLTGKAQERNPRQEPDKPCVYVGSTEEVVASDSVTLVYEIQDQGLNNTLHN